MIYTANTLTNATAANAANAAVAGASIAERAPALGANTTVDLADKVHAEVYSTAEINVPNSSGLRRVPLVTRRDRMESATGLKGAALDAFVAWLPGKASASDELAAVVLRFKAAAGDSLLTFGMIHAA